MPYVPRGEAGVVTRIAGFEQAAVNVKMPANRSKDWELESSGHAVVYVRESLIIQSAWLYWAKGRRLWFDTRTQRSALG
jgi:hypothetical protein